MGSYHSHPEPEVKVLAPQEDEEIDIVQKQEDVILKKLDILTEKIEKMEHIYAGPVPLPSLSAVSASGSLPIQQMSRFQMCMKEIRDNPWLSPDPADRPYETL